MTLRWLLPCLLLAVFAVDSVAQSRAAAGKRLLYRYVDDSGVTVIDFHIPPEHAHRGYQVLGPGGRIIEEVPPQRDPSAETVTRADESAAQRAERELRERRRDESLLLRYSTVADIESARERAIAQLNVRINIERGNLRSLTQQIENAQAQAADLERRGLAVPEEHLSAIAYLQADLARKERYIGERQQEIEDVKLEFQSEIDRFVKLAPLLEQRR
jgi:hypothetical protein